MFLYTHHCQSVCKLRILTNRDALMLMLMWYWVLVLVMEVVGVGCWLGGRHHHAPRLACNLLLVMWQLESPEAEGGAIVFVSVLRLFFVVGHGGRYCQPPRRLILPIPSSLKTMIVFVSVLRLLFVVGRGGRYCQPPRR